MRNIIGIVVILSVVWAGNWVLGFDRNLSKTLAWFDTATYGDAVEQHGFPNRYDVTLPNLKITEMGFSAEFIQIMRMVYKSNHHIIILPPQIKIAGHDITAEQMRASVVTDDGVTPRVTIEAFNIALPNGVSAAHAQISAVPAGGDDAMTVFIELTGTQIADDPTVGTLRLTLHLVAQAPLAWGTLSDTVQSIQVALSGDGTLHSERFGTGPIEVSGRLSDLKLRPMGALVGTELPSFLFSTF